MSRLEYYAYMIKFGTDGWRDIIAERFTYENVRLAAQAHAQYVLAGGGKRVVIGFDTRFQGENFAKVAAQTFAANGLEVHLSSEYLPTPALSFAVVHLQADAGVMITASHNPPLYNGYKIKGAYGGSATPAIVAGIEAEFARLQETPSQMGGSIQNFDIRKAYYQALDRVLDVDVLRSYKGTVFFDAMGGAGAGWLEGYLKHAKCKFDLRPLHALPNPMFYGVNPEPIPQNLNSLSTLLKAETSPVFGVVTDGDADRVGAVLAGGVFFNSHQIFAVLLRHLYQRGLRGRVVKTISGSRIIELLCQELQLDMLETAVGFKYITDAILEGQANPELSVLMGGEESGGMTMHGHIPERDGLLNSLLMIEAVAQSGRGLGELFAEIEALTGFSHFYNRNDLHVRHDFDKAAFLAEVQTWAEVAGYAVEGVNARDGVRLSVQGGAWVLLRASGTEPLIRVYAEASSAEAQAEILRIATERVLAY